MKILNFGILKSPLNWGTILLMVLIAGIAIHLVMESGGINPARATDNPSSPIQ